MSRFRSSEPTAATMRSRLRFIARYGLEDDYFENYARALSQLRPEDVQALIRDELVLERAVIGLRGPSAGVGAARNAFASPPSAPE